MTEATLTSTSASPTARQVWTRTRGIVLAVVILLAAAVAIAAIRSGAQHGRLDPRSADPYGSRATAELLGDRGVSTRVVATLDEARSAAGADTTLLVAAPDLLTDHQQADLRAATKNSGGRTILITPDSPSLGTLAPGVTADPAISFHSTLSPSCDLPAARRAGSADTGGIRYSTSDPGADVCYPSDGLPTLLRIPAATGNGDTVVLGAPDILYNNRLDKQGNASLALQLLGSRPHLVWYLPSLSDTSATDAGKKTFLDLLPSGWLWGTLQLFIAANGRPVAGTPTRPPRTRTPPRRDPRLRNRRGPRPPLPQGQRPRPRGHRSSLHHPHPTRPLIGVSPAQAHAPEALLPALSARLDGDGQALHALLFGPPPSDDAALISLADQLDALEREVRRS